MPNGSRVVQISQEQELVIRTRLACKESQVKADLGLTEPLQYNFYVLKYNTATDTWEQVNGFNDFATADQFFVDEANSVLSDTDLAGRRTAGRGGKKGPGRIQLSQDVQDSLPDSVSDVLSEVL